MFVLIFKSFMYAIFVPKDIMYVLLITLSIVLLETQWKVLGFFTFSQ